MIIKKIKGDEFNEISVELIHKYLPEIEKYIPEIRKLLPEIAYYLENNSCKRKQNKNYCPRPCDSDSLSSDCDKPCKPCKPIKCDINKCDSNKCDDSCDFIFSDTYYKICDNKCPKKYCPESESVCVSEIKCDYKKCESSFECSSEETPKRCDIFCKPNKCDKTNDFDDRIKRIKCHLDVLTDDTDDEKSEDYFGCRGCNDKTYIEHINEIECREISEEEERCASEWDLCELKKKTCKPCQHQCGEFAIDEDLNIFKKRVIKKAEVIISCYKKKLLECEKEKCELERCLEKCRQRNEVLNCELNKCNGSVKKCEEKKKDIMCSAKKCEEQLKCLLEKYRELEEEYKKKKSELEKCHCKNKRLIEDIQQLKHELEKCLCEKNKLKEKVEELFSALIECKKEKAELLKIIQKLKEKLKKCECENTKLQYLIRELKEENHKLNKKVNLLICQNKELAKENADLKRQLGKTLATLKCLCDKYNALKEKCAKKQKRKCYY